MLSLNEFETLSGLQLSVDEQVALLSLRPWVILRTVGADPPVFALESNGYVGAARIGDLLVEVRPKVPLDRVLFMLSYAIDPRQWRELQYPFRDEDTLLDAVAMGFARRLQSAVRRGLLHGYRGVEESGSTVRGRIRLGDKIRSRSGRFPPVEIAYDDFTDDIQENRLLRAALKRLRAARLRSPETRRLLDHLYQLFGSVQDVRFDPRRVPAPVFTRLNAHYRVPIELARIILSGCGWELASGAATATSFFVDMAVVFERFVATAIADCLSHLKGELRQGDRSFALDAAGAIQLKPDLSWWADGSCRFIADAKYKRVAVPGIVHPDLYQLLAYTTASELDHGMLIYAEGEGEPVAHSIPFADKILEVRSVRLSGSPGAILAEVQQLAQLIQSRIAAVTIATA